MADVDVAGTVTAGAFGGDGGREWSFCPYGADTRITEIIITHGSYVKFSPSDVLTTVAGTEIETKGKTLVQSLTFKTDKDEDGYGPYGKTRGTDFEPRLGHNEIVGFYGREGAYIDSFGVIAKPSD